MYHSCHRALAGAEAIYPDLKVVNFTDVLAEALGRGGHPDYYRLYKQGKGNLAAPPGYSNHQSGKALDLNTSAKGVYTWLSKHGATYGFRRTVPSEKWHWEH